MTVETVDVVIDRKALEARNEDRDQHLQRVIQGRKAGKRYREAHASCLVFIEKDDDMGLLSFFKRNQDLDICEIIS